MQIQAVSLKLPDICLLLLLSAGMKGMCVSLFLALFVYLMLADPIQDEMDC